jgi:hypothetical protein
MVDLSSRLKRPVQAICRGESLLLCRARQSGKTTMLRELAQALRKHNLAVILCAMQLAEDQTLTGLFRLIEMSVQKAYPVPALPKWMPVEPQSVSFCAWLGDAQQKLGRPLVLILDEYDAPPRKLVLSLLRSFRSALALADDSRPFVHSLNLCGKTHVRDLRDELRPSGDESRGTGSLWNISLPLPLPALSRAEVDMLLDEYSTESGIPWKRDARDELWRKTRGQPWLVCRICYEIDEQLGCPRLTPDPIPEASPAPAAKPKSGLPSAATVRAVADQLLEEDCVHLLSVSDLLLNRRDAQELVLRLLSGEEIAVSRANEAQSYLLDTGILVPSESGRSLELHNPVYAGYLSRWLTEQN